MHSQNPLGSGITVTEQRVTAQWSYIVSDLDFFLTITGLATHYSHLPQKCMAAASEGLRRIIACKEDGTQLWFEEALQL
jgi:hypothetical protein